MKTATRLLVAALVLGTVMGTLIVPCPGGKEKDRGRASL